MAQWPYIWKMIRKQLPLVLSFILTTIFFLIAFDPESGFNFIPYFIHESVFPSGAGETKFIIGFDAVIGLLFFLAAHRIFTWILKS